MPHRAVSSLLISRVIDPAIYIITTSMGTDRLTYDAVSYLADIGAFERTGTGTFRLTAYGRENWEQRTTPRWYWFRYNWFPASVAAGTILFAGVVANRGH